MSFWCEGGPHVIGQLLEDGLPGRGVPHGLTGARGPQG